MCFVFSCRSLLMLLFAAVFVVFVGLKREREKTRRMEKEQEKMMEGNKNNSSRMMA